MQKWFSERFYLWLGLAVGFGIGFNLALVILRGW